MSGYKIPSFDSPLSECEYNRLRKYCFNAATFLLEKYTYSRKALVDFFVFKKRIPNTIQVKQDNNVSNVDIVSSVIEELEELKLINDKRNALDRAESLLLFRKKSIFYVKNNLRQKGFLESDIDEAIEAIVNSGDFDEQRALVHEADKITRRSSFKNKDFRKRKHVFITALVSKGFSLTEIAELLDRGDYAHFFDEQAEEDIKESIWTH